MVSTSLRVSDAFVHLFEDNNFWLARRRALFDWHPFLDICVQCRKRAISAVACALRACKTPRINADDASANIASPRRRVQGLELFDQNPECREAQLPY